MLQHPAVYKHAVKWAHRNEWAQSIADSHAPSAARQELLDRFWREVGVIERALGPLLAVAERVSGGAPAAAAAAGGQDPEAWEATGMSAPLGQQRPTWFEEG